MVNEFPFGTSQSGKRDKFFRISVCPRNFPVGRIKNRLPFTSQSEFSGICGEWLTTTVTENCTINVISSSNQRGRNCLPKWTFVRSFAPDFLDVFGQNCNLLWPRGQSLERRFQNLKGLTSHYKKSWEEANLVLFFGQILQRRVQTL